MRAALAQVVQVLGSNRTVTLVQQQLATCSGQVFPALVGAFETVLTARDWAGTWDRLAGVVEVSLWASIKHADKGMLKSALRLAQAVYASLVIYTPLACYPCL